MILLRLAKTAYLNYTRKGHRPEVAYVTDDQEDVHPIWNTNIPPNGDSIV